jgi:predicted Rossmann fold nucleotide-binding protein DprA/Smf involved in DNA uptake
MRIGFTGTQKGMNSTQRENLAYLLRNASGKNEFHHGDCIGADAEAHELALDNGIAVILHPPENSTRREFCQGHVHEEAPKPYIERNHDIVDACEVLVATPSGEEVQRSGTWATIRYAKRIGRKCIILYPNGKVENFP